MELFDVELNFPSPRLHDPVGRLHALLNGLGEEALPKPGGRCALLAGSRKIADLPPLLEGLASFLRSRGLDPFIVPAMGSHAGAEPKAQVALLASLGITEKTVGAPIISSEKLALAGLAPAGFEVWGDAGALEADAIIPVNRVKPHTAFRAEVESGCSKMLAVGLGREKSATAAHRAGLARSIRDGASLHLCTGRVPLGVALLENCRGENAGVELLTPHTWFQEEEALLRRAFELYPRLPWPELDLLIVERMGKEYSGTGMDLNVIGMNRRFQEDASPPIIQKVVALALDGSNANGVGYADIVTRALADAVDPIETATNCAASGFAEAGRLPHVEPDEESAINRALADLGKIANVRAVRIPNTAHLTKIQVSRALLGELPTASRRL